MANTEEDDGPVTYRQFVQRPEGDKVLDSNRESLAVVDYIRDNTGEYGTVNDMSIRDSTVGISYGNDKYLGDAESYGVTKITKAEYTKGTTKPKPKPRPDLGVLGGRRGKSKNNKRRTQNKSKNNKRRTQNKSKKYRR
jgi:hypothetical protein